MMYRHRFYFILLLSFLLMNSCAGRDSENSSHEKPEVADHEKIDHSPKEDIGAIKEIEPTLTPTKTTPPTPVVPAFEPTIPTVSSNFAQPIYPRSLGGGGSSPPPSIRSDTEMDMLLHWNDMAIDASGRDHDQSLLLLAGGGREQLGPGRASRAVAIVHVAIFEAILAVKGGYESYANISPVTEETSVEAAVAQAGYESLVAMFPAQAENFADQLALDLAAVPEGPAKEKGIELGHTAASAILTMRETDGSDHSEPIIGVDYFPSDNPGVWRKDPVSNLPVALGANWSTVTPFVLQSAEQFRLPPPPALSSDEYAEAFKEVKRLGGDGVNTPTERTDYESETGLYWAYDGTPSLCAPPRLYNQIAKTIAHDRGTDMVGVARLLALINVGMADAGIASWESKYFYKVWRPVTGIREADPGTGPSTIGDLNSETIGDINFTPMGAPASNMTNAVDFTPPFPSYPSGHATFGGTLFQILRKFYGTDEIVFTFVSDELNGVTLDKDGNPRPLKPRTFYSLSQAEEENGQSRIYLGIHWAFDKTGGITQGRNVGNYVFDNIFVPNTQK